MCKLAFKVIRSREVLFQRYIRKRERICFLCTFQNSEDFARFRKIAKTAISFVKSVCTSVRMEQLGSHATYFYKI
jgi:hypothetical protein